MMTLRSVVLSLMNSYMGPAAQQDPPAKKPYPFDPAVLPTRDDLQAYWLALEKERTAAVRTGHDLQTRSCHYNGTQIFLKCMDLTKSSTANKTAFVAAFKEMLALDDPHIVKVLGISLVVYTTTLCVAMEFMQQGTVLNVILNPKIELSPAQQWRMCLDTARGLQYVHQRGLVHGSLTSSHVLVHADGRCKLNVQAIVKPRAQLVSYGLLELAFQAPEVLEGLAPTAAADVYALAVVCLQIFCRAHAFKDVYDAYGFVQGDLVVRACVLSGEPTRPFAAPSTWPADFNALVARALSRDPTVRPTCDEFVACLSTQVLAEPTASP